MSNGKEFSVIGISELFGMSHNECHLEGYHPLEFAVRNNSNMSKGGVGIFVKNSLKYKHRPDLSIFIEHVFESIFVEIELGNKSVIVGTVYRPNSYPRADIDVFNHNMYELMETINSENKHAYIMGDVNIDLLKIDNHQLTSDYFDNILTLGFSPYISKPTRLTPHSATLIDHIYGNNMNNQITSGIVITDVSDHFGILSIIKHPSYHNPKLTATSYRSFTETNIMTFSTLIKNTDYSEIFYSDDAELSYNLLMKNILTSYESAFPVISKRIPRKYIKRMPWISKGLVTSSIRKSKLLKVKLKRPTEININNYKRYNCIYNKLLRVCKSQYYQEQLQLAKYNTRNTWRLLKSAMNTCNYRATLPESFSHNNQTITDKLDIAENFNLFFSHIGIETSSSVPKSKKHYTNYLPQQSNKSFFMEPTSPSEIQNIISNLKSKQSQDCDNLSTRLIKYIGDAIADPLAHIVNLSLSTGLVPSNMKIAKVIPIFKKGNASQFNNYRPISILPVFSKVLEKVVSNRLIEFVSVTNQIYKHQYGFRKGHSTIHPIIHLLNQIANENDKISKNLTMAVFLDLSKAFDTISHNILISKLENMGIRGVAKCWFESYLSNRKQFMSIQNAKSTTQVINCGVPQGSILGPILFLLYVNDIEHATTLPVLSFADDTSVTYSSNNLNLMYKTMNTELENLNQWFRANKLSLNVNKTKYMIFRPSSNYRHVDNLNLLINNTAIERIGNNCNTKCFKFLGILVDETISWKHHIDSICKKISRANYIINKVKNILNKSSLLTLYHSLVQCHINYGLPVWGSSTHINRLTIMQKKTMRIINRKRYNHHTEPLLKNNEVLKVDDHYKFTCSLFMQLLKLGKLPNSFNTLNYFTISDRPIRQQNMLLTKMKFSRTKFSQNLSLHQFPKIWNDLEPNLRQITSYIVFKKKLKAHFLDKYSHIVSCTNPRCHQCYT